ncbi:MAG: hypothetical protein ACYTDT_14135, partial [Planctomycetota bacterium]
MRWLALLILPMAFCSHAWGQTESEIDGWVTDLASVEWRARETAQRKLISAGEKARKKLQHALENKDLEVSTRASKCLVSIGESFSFAVTFATSEIEGKRTHGRAALKNLFRIDDKNNLRELTQNELQTRGSRRYSPPTTMPKDAAIVLLEALSGMPIYVSSVGKGQWDGVAGDTPIHVEYRGDLKQIGDAVQSINSILQRQYGQKFPKSALVAVPMKIGRANFSYLVPRDQRRGAVRMAANQLVADLLSDGPIQLRAAWLLAQGAATDTEAAANIRDEFSSNPDLTRLMWLALSLGKDEKVDGVAINQEPADALKVLNSADWFAHKVAANYFRTLSVQERTKLLCPIVESSTHVFELLTAIWNLWGCEVTPTCRARMIKLITDTQQKSLASAAVHWFRQALDITEPELDAIWQAAKSQTDAGFFTEALALFQREDIAGRMLGKARESLKGTFQATQQSFAAAILHGQASQTDLELVLERLAGTASQNAPRLAKLQIRLFAGCKELPATAIEKFTNSLQSTDQRVRSLYFNALRRCEPSLRMKVADQLVSTIEKAGKFLEANDKLLDPAKSSQHVYDSWLIAIGVKHAAGDKDSMKTILSVLESENERAATTAAVALVEAVPADQIFNQLEELQASK